jgi:hypothetical protein
MLARDNTRALRNALRRKRAAETAIAEILKRDFPVGTFCHFLGARSIVYPATVTMHGYGDRIKVRNEHTATERWIYADRLHPTEHIRHRR